ncbi:methyl-accepting chemotaxis protein [Sporomusaceae bacterium BoRhaA]|uniref:methyl-accepting chemotaxis protein n=1 Tax=Pelorhabdus rhamnosifermentans TaxID=2772457 RepID=UPI001C060990|nr:methyl-accepting chemotaxis protein [Pelorhabdus rhamnosifermentans]MBU2700399.1 methyl-accepting chemotaxis protein [Pelorhabdus rhamnosifermentans]
MKIGTKISLGLGFIMMLLLVLGFNFYFAAQQNTTSITAIEEANARALLASKAENLYTGAVLEIRRFIADGNDSNRQGFIERMNTVVELENQILAKASPEKKASIEKLISDTNTYYAGVRERLIPALADGHAAKKSGDTAREAQDQLISSATTRELTPFAQELQKALSTIVEDNSKIVKDQVTQSKENASNARTVSITLTGIIFLIGITLSLSLTKMIIKPVKATTTFLDRMAEGDYETVINKALLSRKDEFGEMGQSLASMRSSMRDLIGQMLRQSELLAASSEEMTASADQSAQAANQVAISITDVAKGAKQQLSVANDTAVVVQQMSAKIQQVAANANELATQSAQVAEIANQGNKSMDKAIKKMNYIEENVTASAALVAKLGERSKEIGQILDTITGIAGQTNLLALNAAIEAARAGEQGRGFAVVAEEVRKLAEQSQDSAEQIATLIGEIQSDTDKAVVAMRDGTLEVKLGTEVVNESGQTLLEISMLITQVSGQVKEISSAIDQLAIGTHQFVGSVKQIDELSEKAAEEAQTVSAATEEQSASMEEIASSSQALAQLAVNLRDTASKFQI